MSKVSYAVLVTQVHVPNVGALGPTLTLTAAAAKKIDSMELDGNFLNINISGQTIVVPMTNVSHFTKEK